MDGLTSRRFRTTLNSGRSTGCCVFRTDPLRLAGLPPVRAWSPCALFPPAPSTLPGVRTCSGSFAAVSGSTMIFHDLLGVGDVVPVAVGFPAFGDNLNEDTSDGRLRNVGNALNVGLDVD